MEGPAAGVQAGDHVLPGIPGREHQHGRVVAARAQPLADLQAVQAGEQHAFGDIASIQLVSKFPF